MDLDNYIQKTSIIQYKTDVGFRTLVEGVNEGLYVIPKYQRRYRWDKEKVIDLVDSLICGLPIPPIYTWRNSENQLEILDGQQRVMSLFFYYIGSFMKEKGKKKNASVDFHNLEIKENESFEKALRRQYELEPLEVNLRDDNDRTISADYSQLSPKQKRRVDYTAIPIVEIKLSEEVNKEDVLRKIFANLNKNGVVLTPQEQRNGIYNCKFYDMLHTFNTDNSVWRSLYGALDSKSSDVEQLLRFCALKKYVFSEGGNKSGEVSFSLKSYRGRYEELLDLFSKESVSFTDEEITTYKDDLADFFNLFALTKSRRIVKKTSLIDGLYVVYELTGIRNPITDRVVDSILANQSYKDSTSSGTSSLKNMTKRWQVIYEIWNQQY